MEALPTVRVDVHDLAADAVAIDGLARLALRLRRCGYRLELMRPPQALLELIELAGLAEVLPAEPGGASRG